MKYTIQAVLFDLDGTLLDTLDDLADSMNAVLARFGFPTHPTDRYKYFVGDGVETLVRRTLPINATSPDKVDQLMEAMLQEYGKRWHKKTKLYDGIAPLLERLTEKKIQMTIFSNKPDHFTQKAAKEFLADWPFTLVSGAKPTIPKKPDPTGAQIIAQELNIPCQNFIYIGDTNTDMQTALSAKMHPFGALWGFRSAEELHDAGAEIVLKHPLDLLKHIS